MTPAAFSSPLGATFASLPGILMSTPLLWAGFLLLIFLLLAIDLGVLHRGDRAPTTREALGWTVGWVVLSLLFTGVIAAVYGRGLMGGGKTGPGEASILYLTGYLIEKLLSLDNIFVMAALMSAFRVPPSAQHRVLYWGILGALVLRGVMIVAGTAILSRFTWLMVPLGLALVFTGAKMLFHKEAEEEGSGVSTDNVLVRVVRRFFPVAPQGDGSRFFVRQAGRWAVTPVFLALIAIEASDVIFALDSVPAVLAVTLDPFIVFTSNVFAILGLRSLYFVLGSMLDRFALLKPALAFILVFVGVKLGLNPLRIHVPPFLSLGLILLVLLGAVVLSLRAEKKQEVPPGA